MAKDSNMVREQERISQGKGRVKKIKSKYSTESENITSEIMVHVEKVIISFSTASEEDGETEPDAFDKNIIIYTSMGVVLLLTKIAFIFWCVRRRRSGNPINQNNIEMCEFVYENKALEIVETSSL